MAHFIPADVPKALHKTFLKNYTTLTHNTNKLFLFSCDQKMEHMNDDFDGAAIHPDARDPHHLFTIASKAPIGALATHVGMIARYGNNYPSVPYIAKLNGSTNLVSHTQRDPVSAPLWSVEDVMMLKESSKLLLCGIGITIYPGSTREDEMLSFAAQETWQAHRNGLVAILWVYPRGASISKETDTHLIAGAAGLANSLGADFVKIKPPHAATSKKSAELLKTIVAAAGNTRVICSGGERIKQEIFLETLRNYMHIGGIAGAAVGRNIFQHAQRDAIAMAKEISQIVYQLPR